MTKLNKKRVKWLVDQVAKHDKKPQEVACVYNVTGRRVQQLVQEYRETKKYPELKKDRRPRTALSNEQEKRIEECYKETLLTPRLLYFELKRRGYYAPKNKIYCFMKNKGWIWDEPAKKKKRKRADMNGSIRDLWFMLIITAQRRMTPIVFSGWMMLVVEYCPVASSTAPMQRML